MAEHITADSTVNTEAARWQQLSRVTGIAGLAFFALTVAWIVTTSVSGKEPAFDGTADEVLAYFRATSSALAGFGSYLVVVGMVAMIWFAIGLALLLGRAEGRPPWRSSVAAASALVFVGLVLSTPGEAASYRVQTLTPELATYAFDVGNLGFANGWVAMGSFLLCAGWAMISTRFAPRWLGWLAVAGGVGLVLSRAVWTSEIWLLPYAFFWLWVIIVSVRLLRREPARKTSPGGMSA
ncbi:MAG TPA: hypothetical protein VHR39_18415 [Propionibacteriaceae bacterium]|jgi:hypothetical protein|nr:hypothetical protein [Propionibacteriaceae bacterium]